VSDQLSDNRSENDRTSADDVGRLTCTEVVQAAGRAWSGSAWGSRGRRFKSCRPDGWQGGTLRIGVPPLPASMPVVSDLESIMLASKLDGLLSESGANLEHTFSGREMGSGSAPGLGRR
jgi:hypothetical protein